MKKTSVITIVAGIVYLLLALKYSACNDNKHSVESKDAGTIETSTDTAEDAHEAGMEDNRILDGNGG